MGNSFIKWITAGWSDEIEIESANEMFSFRNKNICGAVIFSLNFEGGFDDDEYSTSKRTTQLYTLNERTRLG